MDADAECAFRPARLQAPLEHFAVIEDPREPPLAAIAMVEANVEQAGAVATTRRFHLSPAPLAAPRLAAAPWCATRPFGAPGRPPFQPRAVLP